MKYGDKPLARVGLAGEIERKGEDERKIWFLLLYQNQGKESKLCPSEDTLNSQLSIEDAINAHQFRILSVGFNGE